MDAYRPLTSYEQMLIIVISSNQIFERGRKRLLKLSLGVRHFRNPPLNEECVLTEEAVSEKKS